MGDNEVRLVEEYIRLTKELENLLKCEVESLDELLEITEIQGRIAGMVFAYETYTSAHWSTMKGLVEKYHDING